MEVIFRVNLLGNLKYTNEHLGNFFNTARKGGGGKVMYLHSYHLYEMRKRRAQWPEWFGYSSLKFILCR